jgi:hypothetical protein
MSERKLYRHSDQAGIFLLTNRHDDRTIIIAICMISGRQERGYGNGDVAGIHPTRRANGSSTEQCLPIFLPAIV